MTNLDSILKSRDITLPTKVMSSQGYGFFSSHVWMRELDYKERWVKKNWCFWTVVLEKTLESPLDCKEIQPVHLKGNQSWIFTWRSDAKAETPILWSPDVKHWLTGKDPDVGKDWRQEEKGKTEDEMVGWNHWLNGHEFEQAPGVGDGQRCLAYCSPWGRKELDRTEWLNWTEELGTKAVLPLSSWQHGRLLSVLNHYCPESLLMLSYLIYILISSEMLFSPFYLPDATHSQILFHHNLY